MKLEDMTDEQRAHVDTCTCEHVRTAHAPFGGACMFKGCKCARFTWARFDTAKAPKEVAPKGPGQRGMGKKGLRRA